MPTYSLKALRRLFALREDRGNVARGIYLGYPLCCIEEFILFSSERRRAIAQESGKLPERGYRTFEGSGYVPCAKCHEIAADDPEKFVDEVIEPNRINGYPFPNDPRTDPTADIFIQDFTSLMIGVEQQYFVSPARFHVQPPKKRGLPITVVIEKISLPTPIRNMPRVRYLNRVQQAERMAREQETAGLLKERVGRGIVNMKTGYENG